MATLSFRTEVQSTGLFDHSHTGLLPLLGLMLLGLILLLGLKIEYFGMLPFVRWRI